ncbi:GAF domain-like protein [Scheffersomyces amazonensis]|uniref:GAF domain-like protein n=1 Tax=Scheffersomyces amazonensis TaxID=1078765 RepID=UPI00315C928C
MGEDGKHHADYSNIQPGTLSKEETLQHVVLSYEALAADTSNWVANLSNCSSLLWHAYHSLSIPVNWTGFYVLHTTSTTSTTTSELILGPFQGKVACQLIQFGKGVCGTAASSQLTQLVPDVEQFPGHIACDGETKSEIVVPIIKDGKTIGVLDLDCLKLEGFDEIDKKYLQQLAELIVQTCDFPF